MNEDIQISVEDKANSESCFKKRIFLKIAYDGSSYHGFAYLPNKKTIEGCIIDAIEIITGERITIIGASRTDAGVHAYGNVAVFDTKSSIPPEKFANALNSKLPDDIRIIESCEVPGDFHPRRWKTEKTYEYRILNTVIPIPTERLYTCHSSYELDINKMNDAAKYLVGEHDFGSFCSAGSQTLSHVRTIQSVEIIKKENIITIRVTGGGFLYNMVRIIAGTLMDVGRGKIKPDEMKEIINKKDRTYAGPTAPPQGLFLMDIKFGKKYQDRTYNIMEAPENDIDKI